MLSEQNQTICACATAQGGAINIIRVSGTHATELVDKIYRTGSGHRLTDSKGYSTRYGTIYDGEQILDEAITIVYKSPHSYTGEDMVELMCHGSRYVTQRILLLLSSLGCRAADPGEFTQRAYLNGKMDLSQAEAVADLIAAENKATHEVAIKQLKGNVSTELHRLRNQLLHLTTLLELELDFSDHEDLEFADRSELLSLSQTIDQRILHLIDSFETGQAIRRGIPVAIVGKTNVGKSTLLNQLLHDDRAIVSDQHGTTRDSIEDTTIIQGITFFLH